MLEAQALLTLAFNIVCIGYSTLCFANFVIGLCEEWMKPTHSNTSSVTTVEEEQSFSDVVMEEETVIIPDGWSVIEPHQDDYYRIDDLTYTIRQLKAMAREQHIKGYSNMRKHELILALFH